MKYTKVFRTYNPLDGTDVGWFIEANAKRARLIKRSRWQGARNDVVVTCVLEQVLDEGSLPLTDLTAHELALALDKEFALGCLELRRGSSSGGFTVQSTGYIVR